MKRQGKAITSLQLLESLRLRNTLCHLMYQLSYCCLCRLYFCWDCLRTSWRTWIMRVPHLEIMITRATSTQGCSDHHLCQLIVCWQALFLLIPVLLPLFGANMLFNQMRTNLANSIKFICSFFKSPMNIDFSSPTLCLKYGIYTRQAYLWLPKLLG